MPAKIVLTIDYEPDLDHYPSEVTTKAEALEFDIQAVISGEADVEGLLQIADDIIYQVRDV